jgi:hypothetical protein
LIDFLRDHNIYNVEIIPKRNKISIVEEYANFFHQNGFIVTFGTEHNTKRVEPIKVLSKDGLELSDRLKKINYDGACVIAAHQYLVARSQDGYCNIKSTNFSERDGFVKLGNRIIKNFVN